MDKFKARITCKFCGKTNHTEAECWSKEKAERKAKKNDTQRNSFADNSNPRKRKLGEISFLKAFYLDTKISGQRLDSIIDTGASISAVARRFTQGSPINHQEAIPICVGNGEIIYSLGTTNVEVNIGPALKLTQKCHVVDTMAFDCVLGLDFLNSQPVNGLLLKPPRLIVNNEEFALKEDTNPNPVSKLFRMFQTEDYKLRPDLRTEVLEKLGVSEKTWKLICLLDQKTTKSRCFVRSKTQLGSTIGENYSKMKKGTCGQTPRFPSYHRP